MVWSPNTIELILSLLRSTESAPLLTNLASNSHNIALELGVFLQDLRTHLARKLHIAILAALSTRLLPGRVVLALAQRSIVASRLSGHGGSTRRKEIKLKRGGLLSHVSTMSRPVRTSDYSLLESFLEDPNTMKMRQMDRTSFHIAMLMRRGKILGVASNRVGSRSRGCGYATYTIHAERNVIKQFGDTSKLKGCDLFVMNISLNKMTGEKHFKNSKPCHDCQLFLEKCQTEYGLKNVYYTQT